MVRKIALCLLAAVILAGVSAPIAHAQTGSRQSVSLNLGYFTTPPEDARKSDDVLVQNLNFLLFDLDDFNGAMVGADYLLGLGEYLEAGVGVAYRRRTVPSGYADFVDSDGTEIFQELKLRVTPVTLSMRFLPFGHRNRVQPYVGAGLGIFTWRYAETGEFVDFRDGSIFRASYVDTGTDTGLVVVGGVRAHIGVMFGAGFELQYHDAQGSLDPEVGFFGDHVNVGGWLSQATFRIRF